MPVKIFYYGKKPYLKKVDDLYFISESGVSFLWNYFVSNNIIPENFKEEFFVPEGGGLIIPSMVISWVRLFLC